MTREPCRCVCHVLTLFDRRPDLVDLPAAGAVLAEAARWAA